MKFLGLIIPLFILGCTTEKSIDSEKLTRELDSIFAVDQKYRAEMQKANEKFGWDSPEKMELWTKQREIDESNLKRIIEIINEVGGYPGKTLVGDHASAATFFVLQHAPDSIQEKYYTLIIEAAVNGELEKRLAAMYQDRYLMHKGEPQIFGTQVKVNFSTDSTTGEKIKHISVWTIADTTNIDSLRMANGHGKLEDYLNGYGISRWE